MPEHSGWKNRATWNVALWLGNDESLHQFARQYARAGYARMVADLAVAGITHTPDGVAYASHQVDHQEINAMIEELCQPL